MLSNTWRTSLKCIKGSFILHRQWKLSFHSHGTELDEGLIPQELCRVALAKLVRLSYILKNVESVDGKFICVYDNSIINDVYIIKQMQNYNSLARVLIREASLENTLKGSSTIRQPSISSCSSSWKNWRPMTLNSLTKICDVLGVSAQQRKNVRLKVCPQITQHRIWRGALDEVLKNLMCEMDSVGLHSPAFQMAKQVITSCLKFINDNASIKKSEVPAWMRWEPLKKVEKQPPLHKWAEVLEMFVHLSRCMGREERLFCDITKVEAMKEGLYQIKDILIEKDLSLKDERRQDSLVQKKLTKSLGHSSRCLFTLLIYYLYGTVSDIDIEVCGGVCIDGGKFGLQIGKILTSDDEKMVRNAVKELYRALGVFKFVWETTSMKGTINLHGHLWSVGADERTITYRGKEFFVHDIRV